MDQAVSDRQAEIQAKIEASKKAAVAPIDNTVLVTDFRKLGGQILHVPPQGKRVRGMTVAFIPKNGRVEIATAIQHRNDNFTKKVGTKTAIEHFNAGKTVFLPVQNGIIHQALRDLNFWS